MTEKLQKVLARAGLGSRRQMEDWIAAGRASVNGVRATLGDRVEGTEIIRVDGHIVPARRLAGSRRRVLLYNKPEREMCTRDDPEGRPTVFDRLPPTGSSRWVSIGRLDFNTMGLLILTTDGELAHRISHPSFGMEREYAVRVLGQMPEDALTILKNGVELDDGPARFEHIHDAGGEGANHWYHVVLGEGRNREVRRMFEAVGGTVSRLIRLRYGDVTLPRGVQRGRWEEMDADGVRRLAASVGLRDDPGDAGGGRSTQVRGQARNHAGKQARGDARDHRGGQADDRRSGQAADGDQRRSSSPRTGAKPYANARPAPPGRGGGGNGGRGKSGRPGSGGGRGRR